MPAAGAAAICDLAEMGVALTNSERLGYPAQR